MFDIVLLGLILVNFVFLVVIYDKLSPRIEELEYREKTTREVLVEKFTYNESVDPITADAEMHDYLVRLAKEEKE